MATIIFFEKTGCINNTKQKKILTMGGHEVNAVDLIKHPWTSEELMSFFEELEVEKWFNLNAPSVQSGEVIPEKFDKKSALQALLNDHLLIKRPLLIIGGHKLVGFDKVKIDQMVGIDKSQSDIMPLLGENLDVCPQLAKKQTCD